MKFITKYFPLKIQHLELYRFLVAGGINALFGYSIGFLFLFFLPFHYSVSVLLATIVGVLFNYINNSKFVFRSSFSAKKLGLFLLNYAIIYFLNVLIMTLIIETLELDPWIAFIFAIPPLVVVTYIIQKKYIFK